MSLKRTIKNREPFVRFGGSGKTHATNKKAHGNTASVSPFFSGMIEIFRISKSPRKAKTPFYMSLISFNFFCFFNNFYDLTMQR